MFNLNQIGLGPSATSSTRVVFITQSSKHTRQVLVLVFAVLMIGHAAGKARGKREKGRDWPALRTGRIDRQVSPWGTWGPGRPAQSLR